MDQPCDEAAPKAVDAVERNPFFKPFYSRLHECLRTRYVSYGNWKGLEVYQPLKELAEELLTVGGFKFQLKVDGTERINLRFTTEMTPTLEEKWASGRWRKRSTLRWSGKQGTMRFCEPMYAYISYSNLKLP
jgi:hypothetical protein